MSEPSPINRGEPGQTWDALLHQLGEANPGADLLLLFNEGGFLLDASPAARGFLGFFPAGDPGPHLADLFGFPRGQEIQEADHRLWAGAADEFFLSLTNPAGIAIPVAARFSEGTWKDGAVHYAVCKVVPSLDPDALPHPERPPEHLQPPQPEPGQLPWAETFARRKEEIEALLSGIDAQLVRLEPISLAREIPLALEIISRFVQADRGYLIHFLFDQGFAHTVYEWCAPGIPSQNVKLSGPPAQAITWWMAAIANQEIIHISNLEYLPPEAQAEKDLLRAQGIQSMAAAPLVHQSQAIGFLGLDAVRAQKDWSQEDLYLLQRASEMFANILMK